LSNKTSIGIEKHTTYLTMKYITFIILIGLANCAPKKSSPIAHFTHIQEHHKHESGAVIPYNNTQNREIVYRNWILSDWVDRVQFNKSFHYNNGRLTIKRAGPYFVYAQLTYHDLSGRWAFGINVNEATRIKCLATEQIDNSTNYNTRSHGIYHQCYTGSLMYLDHHDSLTIQCLYGMRTILTNDQFTFWGLIKF
jgi:hypothetical protein